MRTVLPFTLLGGAPIQMNIRSVSPVIVARTFMTYEGVVDNTCDANKDIIEQFTFATELAGIKPRSTSHLRCSILPCTPSPLLYAH